MADDAVVVAVADAVVNVVTIIIIIIITFTRAIAVDVGVAIVVYHHRRPLRGCRHRRHYGHNRYRRLVMLNPVVNQSKTVLCTELGIHNVDAPF